MDISGGLASEFIQNFSMKTGLFDKKKMCCGLRNYIQSFGEKIIFSSTNVTSNGMFFRTFLLRDISFTSYHFFHEMNEEKILIYSLIYGSSLFCRSLLIFAVQPASSAREFLIGLGLANQILSWRNVNISCTRFILEHKFPVVRFRHIFAYSAWLFDTQTTYT